MKKSRSRTCAGGGGAWAGVGRDGSHAGGRGLLTDTRILSDDTRCSTTAGARERVTRRRPATGNRTPTPNEHARRGSPAGESHSACSRAIGKKNLPPTRRLSRFTVIACLHSVLARNRAGASWGIPGGMADARCRIVRVKQAPLWPIPPNDARGSKISVFPLKALRVTIACDQMVDTSADARPEG